MTGTRHDAAAAARMAFECGAIYTRTSGDPFFFTSGWASPIFVDIKRLISMPAARDALISMALARIEAALGPRAFDFVTGCELAGVPFAAIIADRLQLPLVIVRKQSKGFGRLAQFEGTFEPGARALLIDDLATDGISKLGFRSALERAEAKVVGAFVILDYAVFPTRPDLVSLLTLADVIATAETRKSLNAEALEQVKAFVADAPRWSRRHGGIGALPQPLDGTTRTDAG